MHPSLAGHIRKNKWQRWWNIWVIGKINHEEILADIIREAGWSGRYAFLVIISASLALLGLLMPSVAVVIGAMLLSPLMAPIMGLGFAIATLDFAAMRKAGFALGAGAALAVTLCALLVLLSPLQSITDEIAGRIRPTLFDLLVALLSAIAGAYALVKDRGGAVVGVAIAIALMPPLAVVGFGIATWNWTVFSGALLLFLTNAVTIALTAALVARIFGFGSYLTPSHTGWQIMLFVVALGILSIPLSTALRQITFETIAQRQTRDIVSGFFPEGSRLSQISIDFQSSPLRVEGIMLTPKISPNADQLLAQQLQQKFSRPFQVQIDQLKISEQDNAAEAAQASQAANQRIADLRRQTIDQLSLISADGQRSMAFDDSQKIVSVESATLPGLSLSGYRNLEAQANAQAQNWTVRVIPPEQVALPPLNIEQGVVDSNALDIAAWASKRAGKTILVQGGTAAQKEAIITAISGRGGKAEAGAENGRLLLSWPPPPAAPQPSEAPEQEPPSE